MQIATGPVYEIHIGVVLIGCMVERPHVRHMRICLTAGLTTPRVHYKHNWTEEEHKC